MPAGPAVRAYLGLGSNLGERATLLRAALAHLADAPGVTLVAVSDVYETDPVGGPEQGAFLNLVASIDTTLAPLELLGLCHEMERAAERVREERWGPRTLDVDVLWIDGYTSDDLELTVPHPRMWERRFVLAPLSELAPELLPADWEQQAVGDVRRLGPLG